MKNSIKLIITDMDDTLLDSRGGIPEENRLVIRAAQKAGIAVTLASGRMFCSELETARQLEITLPLIGYNGAMIREPLPPYTILSHHTLEESQAREIITRLKPFGTHINAYLEDVFLVEDDNFHAREYSKSKNAPYHLVDSFLSLPSLAFTKLLVIEKRAPVMEEVRRVLKGLSGPEIYFSSRTFCEIIPRGVSKGTALEFLCGHLGISPKEVLAFGDQENDIPMLKKAGIGIAMGNAGEAVKEAANDVTLTCDEAGVAHGILRYLPELKKHL